MNHCCPCLVLLAKIKHKGYGYEGKKEEEIRKEREEVRSETNSLRYDGKKRKNEGTKKVNNLWLWFGVLVLIMILLWWLWSIGIFEDMTGVTNG